jgi:hypothetical protein
MGRPAKHAEERRTVSRAEVNEPARLRPNDWSVLTVHIVDFSPQGFRASCDATLKPHSYVSLEIGGIGSVPARVVWSDQGQFGAKFIHPINPAHCAWTRRDAQRAAWDEATPHEARQVAELLAIRARDRSPLAPQERTDEEQA